MTPVFFVLRRITCFTWMLDLGMNHRILSAFLASLDRAWINLLGAKTSCRLLSIISMTFTLYSTDVLGVATMRLGLFKNKY